MRVWFDSVYAEPLSEKASPLMRHSLKWILWMMGAMGWSCIV